MTGVANSAASWYRASAAGSEESRKVNGMKVYLVVFEWSTEDDSDVDIEAFDSYEKAAERFNERIQEEKTDMSWVHEAFDESDNILAGYDFDECPPDNRLETYAYWTITQCTNWLMKDYLAIVKLEVK